MVVHDLFLLKSTRYLQQKYSNINHYEVALMNNLLFKLSEQFQRRGQRQKEMKRKETRISRKVSVSDPEFTRSEWM